MTTEIRRDAVLSELWALKDERARHYGDIDQLVRHLRAVEADAQEATIVGLSKRQSAELGGQRLTR